MPSSQHPRRKWIPIAVVGCLIALALPFVVRETISYYTDGDTLREDARDAEESLRTVLWERSHRLDARLSDPSTDDYEPRVSPHGDELIFTRGRPGENADLWGSARRRGRWLPPEPLDAVNTDDDELGAAFSADGERLYFYSNRAGGFGGYDIWSCVRTSDGTWG